MQEASVSSNSSEPFAEPGRSEVEDILGAMSPTERLTLFWRMQAVALARSWALVERSGLSDPRERIGFVIRARYPEWSEVDADRLLDAICQREDPVAWLERLRRTAEEIKAGFAREEPHPTNTERSP
jgi:hypothetical protein